LPLDLSLGLKIPTKPLFLNFNNYNNSVVILEMLIYYILLAIAFYVGYTSFNYPNNRDRGRKVLDDFNSYGWVIIIFINLFITVIYLDSTSIYSKAQKSLLARSDLSVFSITMLPTLAQSISIIYILGNKRRLLNNLIFLSIIFLSLMTGDRSNVVIIFLIFMSINDLRFSFKQIMIIAPVAIFFLLYWKVIYFEIIQFIFFGEKMDFFYYTPKGGISSAEFISATNILAFTITNPPNQLLMGVSYVLTPIMLAIPRFLFDFGVTTMAENFVLNNFPDIAARGNAMGFSIIAESLINFGRMGPIIIGCFWGGIAKILDSRKKDIIFVIGLFIFMKLFRADFATLIKSHMIVFGGICFILSSLMYCFKFVTKSSKRIIVMSNNKYF
tara:strand:+ start:867 stop:2021 length:1155 start_codon:yes stop_codon:yes gene_type:complete